MLTTSNEYSKAFLNHRRLLLDSCVLNDLASEGRTQAILQRAGNTFSFVYCAVSILEVGFGPPEKIDDRQDQLARKIYGGEGVTRLDVIEMFAREKQGVPYPPGSVYSYNPGHQEWYAARHNLMRAMEILRIGGKRARELSNDAIVYFSAWNSRSALITNNVKDFDIFNKVMMERTPYHMLPIFTIDDLELSLDRDVSFPENLTQQH